MGNTTDGIVVPFTLKLLDSSRGHVELLLRDGDRDRAIVSLGRNVVASYILELVKANPAWIGIQAVSVQGQASDVGDSEQQFTI